MTAEPDRVVGGPSAGTSHYVENDRTLCGRLVQDSWRSATEVDAELAEKYGRPWFRLAVCRHCAHSFGLRSTS